MVLNSLYTPQPRNLSHEMATISPDGRREGPTDIHPDGPNSAHLKRKKHCLTSINFNRLGHQSGCKGSMLTCFWHLTVNAKLPN